MKSHDLGKPFLFSKKLKWSWPSLSISTSVQNYNLSQGYISDLLISISEEGFNGILIDTFGYEDKGKSIVNEIVSRTNSKSMNSADNRYVFINLLDFRKKINL